MSLEFTALIFVALASFLLLLIKTALRRDHLASIPTAPSSEASLFWGHEYLALKSGPGVEYLRWAVVSPVFRIKAALFDKDILIITDNLAVHHILQNAYQYVKPPPFLPIIVRAVGRGLVWAEGDYHKRLRKVVLPAFTVNAIRNMSDDVFEGAENLVHRIASDTQHSHTINMLDYTSACTLEVFARIGFGQPFSYDSPESKAISTAWRADNQKLSGFMGFLAPILINKYPWLVNAPIPELSEDGVAKKILIDIGKKLLENGADGSGERKDIFSLLVRDSKLSHEQIVENIITFFMVGFETTALAIAFTILNLGQDPSLQTKLRTELSTSDINNYDTLDRLPFLDAVIREGLRLHPAAKDTERIACKDDVLPLNTPMKLMNGDVVQSLHIKAGDRLIVPWAAVNLDPTVWGADSLEFKPERWLVPGGVPPPSMLPRGPYLSFSDGPRVCIGWRLAVMELKIILAQLVSNFEFADTGAVVTKRFTSGMTPFVDGMAGQIPVRVSPCKL